MAVVNEDGRLIAQLSASDLKGAAMGDLFHSLNLPLVDFLVRQSIFFLYARNFRLDWKAITSKRMDKRTGVLTVYPDQTLVDAVALFASVRDLESMNSANSD